MRGTLAFEIQAPYLQARLQRMLQPGVNPGQRVETFLTPSRALQRTPSLTFSLIIKHCHSNIKIMFNTQKGISQSRKMHNFPMPALLVTCNEVFSFPPFRLTASYSDAGNTPSRAFQKHLKPREDFPLSALSRGAHPLIPSPSGGRAGLGSDLSS